MRNRFKDGDLALFLPKGKFHEAFNINQPNYFLSEICYQIHEYVIHFYFFVVFFSNLSLETKHIFVAKLLKSAHGKQLLQIIPLYYPLAPNFMR